MNTEKSQNRALRGMERALAHAIDMNRNGLLEEAELDQFIKYLIGRSLEGLTTEEFVQHRQSGEFDRLHAVTAHDDGVDPYDGQKCREAIAGRIVADLLSRMFEAGHVDQETYLREMQKMQMVPQDVVAQRQRAEDAGEDGPSDQDAALAAWGQQVLGPREPSGSQTSQPENSEEVEPEFIEAFQKQLGRRRAPAVVVRERAAG
jgi:hypothetical protein